MASASADEAPTFDVYARPFVPQALKDVNTAPANTIDCTPVRSIDLDKYSSTFAGTDFLHSHRPKRLEALTQSNEVTSSGNSNAGGATSDSSRSSPPSSQRSGNEIIHPAPSTYEQYFHEALTQEAAGQQAECDDHALFRVALTKADPNIDPRPFIYTLHVPGLRELSLQIEVGDIVQLRQIRFDAQGQILSGSMFKDEEGRPIPLPRKHDTQHNAVVWTIDRLRENLSLRVDNLKPRSMLFNVQFTTQSNRLNAMYSAVSIAQTELTANRDGWMRSMLFPQDSDGYYQKTLNRRDHDLELHDSLLNYEQTRAVSTVADGLYGPVPFIFLGPPGTGKTKTLVELALQLLAQRKNSHLLLCAPSDPAADTLVQRLSAHLNPGQLLRVNPPARSFPEVPMAVLPFCHVDDGMFSIPNFETLMKKTIVITTCRDADLLSRAHVTNTDLCQLEQKLHGCIFPDASPARPRQLHWTGLLIDEAAQATEPEALIPMTVVAPPHDSDIPDQQLPVVALAGDQHQLGPRTSQGQSMRSLFERLSASSFYAEHPLARSSQTRGVIRPLTQDMLPILRPAFVNLIRNYRSHPAILATPSKLFYNNTLEPEASGTDALREWPGWQGRGWPVLFSCNTAPDEIEQDGGGWYNNREAQVACQYAASFTQSGLVAAQDVCIMSSFRAQVRVLRKLARDPSFAMPGINIGPLEAFQGLEKRVVILCTTRTRDRFLDQDMAKGLGVIHQPKRFNVALTRAMHGLIVIGNPFLLEKDQDWKAFMGFCARNGLWEEKSGTSKTWKFNGEEADATISRLERQMVQREDEAGDVGGLSRGVRQLGVGRDAEHDMWRSGVEAEMVIEAESEELQQ